jgi:hypothetical protein
MTQNIETPNAVEVDFDTFEKTIGNHDWAKESDDFEDPRPVKIPPSAKRSKEEDSGLWT